MAKEKIDWSGMKFRIAEEMGEHMDIVFHALNPDGEDELYIMSHKDHDGVGGFTRVLEEIEGFRYEQMPAMKKSEPLGFFARLKKLWAFIRLTRPVAILWKKRLDKTGRASGHVTAFLAPEQVELLQEMLKQKECSVTSGLFWALDRVVTQELLKPGSERKWVSPVNMRGAVEVDNLYGNVAASVVMNFQGEVTPREIHENFRQYFKEAIYMGSWLYTNMARFIGLWGTRRIARKIKDLGVGVFSNMGPWPPASYHHPNERAGMSWVGVAPTSQILPVACAVLQWRDRLAISLSLHPSLDLPFEKTEELLRAMLDQFEQPLSEKAVFRSVTAEELDRRGVRLPHKI